MARKFKYTYKKNWAWGWGVFFILIAALILANHFGGFVSLGFWSLLVAALAVAFLVQCIANMSFGSLPIPIATLYYIFCSPLGLPSIRLWPTLVVVTLLATAGFHILFAKRNFRKRSNIEIDYSFCDTSEKSENAAATEINIEDDSNNPRISVKCGAISRYLHADALETAELECKMGSLEVYFDNVKVSPNGAVIDVDCKLGAIEMYLPAEWQVSNNIDASLGGVDIKGRNRAEGEGAPKVKITGNVSLGGIEIHRI
ncbi:MAG: cell wall-active antibiotics response protein [Oscillospiraceae bacterium]|nr:cell wall-active antibiotics response protein [Oscillospiraceae bacterium]